MKDNMKKLEFCYKVRFLYLQAQHIYDSYLIKRYPNEGCANGKAIT